MVKSYRTTGILLTALVLGITISSCSLFEGDPVNIDQLNRSWELVEMKSENGSQIPLFDNELHVIRFADDNTFSGSTACNDHGGDYFPEGDGDIKIENIIVTDVACSEPNHSVEFLDGLAEADQFITDSGRLVLRYGEEGRLEFQERLE